MDQVTGTMPNAQAAQRFDIPVSGMSCAACVRRVERALAAVPGVASVSVNLATERAAVAAVPTAALTGTLAGALAAAGYPSPETTLDFTVTGMSCASCSVRVERALLAVPGVLAADVNLAADQVRVRLLAGAADAAALQAAVRRAGYGAAIPATHPAPARLAWTDGMAAAAALILAAPLLLPMLLMPFGVHAALPPVGQLALATAVQLVFGARFYRGAWGALRAGAGSMDTLVALGTTAAFGLSVWSMMARPGGAGHGGPLYFEASAAVIALVRLGKWLEDRARRQAGEAVRALDQLRPARARIREDGAEREIPVADLRVGDHLVVRPGERFAADGIVREGSGSADESLLTGEALPVPKQPGGRVTGGALNGESLLLVAVTAVGAESQLARMVRLMEDAQAAKPPVQRQVDRISAVFVPVVVALAALTLLGWWLAGAGVSVAVVNAVSVLVIACPCALGLATPVAIIAGAGAAARHGILIRDPAALEQARAIRTVVFDKTGTLTAGTPTLAALHPAPGEDAAAVLRLAAALERGSEHPLARAVLAAAPDGPAAQGIRALPGGGLEGVAEGRKLLLGNARLMRDHGVSTASLDDAAQALDGRTLSFLATLGPATASLETASLGMGNLATGNPAVGSLAAGSQAGLAADGPAGRVLGLLAFGDALRPGAAEAVAALQARGLHVVLLTGDTSGAAAAAGRALGITDVRAEALPAGKAAAIAALRAGGPVAMVGDGVNDAPALAAADLGMAMATGTDAAAAAAGITLMRGDPLLVPAALDIAGRTVRRIRSGLLWAFTYNLVGIPLAAAGLLSPVAAGAAMAFSSVAVVGNALLLRRWRPGR